MQQNELLLTIAEVSLAFAGLVGIAGLFGSQSRPDLFRAQFFLVIAMVGYALIAALFAFLPFVIAALGASASTAFRICSFILALSISGWTAYGYSRARQLRKSGNSPPHGVAEFMAGTLLLVAIALLFGTLGLLGERASGFYTFAVFLQLAFSGYFFFRLVWSLRPQV